VVGRRAVLAQVEELGRQGRWAELLALCVEMADASRATRDVGHASWQRQAVHQAAHRIAVEGPARVAAQLVRQDWQHLGPLWEVVATRHAWADLRDHAPPGEGTHLAAHTRVLLGEDLSGDGLLDPAVLGLPFVLQPWEAHAWGHVDDMPHYSRSSMSTGGHAGRATGACPLPEPGRRLDDGPAETALEHLVHDWGNVATVTVAGTALHAVAALHAGAGTTHVQGSHLPAGEVFPALIGPARGDGPHTTYRGTAVGRLLVWRALAAMADVAPGDYLPVDEITAFVDRCRWFTWAAPDDEIWHLHIAVDDPARGRAWALSAQAFD